MILLYIENWNKRIQKSKVKHTEVTKTALENSKNIIAVSLGTTLLSELYK